MGAKEKKVNVLAVIQARMGSTRLPGKVLKTIAGKTMIERIFDRLKACNEVDTIALATSTNKENDALAEHATHIGLATYRGNENDLISRHGEALRKFKGDALIRITADCPLVDPLIVDEMVKLFRKSPDFDLVTNIFPRSFPKGLDIEIISSEAFAKLDKDVTDPYYRELLTYYIMEHPQTFRIMNFPYEKDLSLLRWTVDYQEDLEFVEKIYDTLLKEKPIFTMQDVLTLLEEHPELSKINERWIGI